MTFYHGGGTQRIEPNEWKFKMGDWFDLNSKKIILKQK